MHFRSTAQSVLICWDWSERPLPEDEFSWDQKAPYKLVKEGGNKKSYLALIPGKHMNGQGGMVTLRAK